MKLGYKNINYSLFDNVYRQLCDLNNSLEFSFQTAYKYSTVKYE